MDFFSSLKEKNNNKAIKRKAKPLIIASGERDAASNKDIGVKARNKNNHFATGTILIAKYIDSTHTIKLTILPRYIKTKGERDRNLPIRIPIACGKYGIGEYCNKRGEVKRILSGFNG